MARHKRRQNKKDQHKNKKINDVAKTIDKQNFPGAYFSTTSLFDHMSKDSFGDDQLPYYGYLKDTTTEINSNSTLHRASLKEEDNPSVVNSNKSFHPKLQNSSIINSPRSITHLIMKGDQDNPLVRVATARPTIIIYPTGKSINIFYFIKNNLFFIKFAKIDF